MAHGIPTRLTPAEGRRFGLTVGCAFLALALFLWWRDTPLAATVAAGLGGALLGGGLAVPGRLGPVYRGWMALALLLSRVTTPLLMGGIYFLVITPIALLMRALGHKPLTSASRPDSAWVTREAGPGRRGDLEHQF